MSGRGGHAFEKLGRLKSNYLSGVHEYWLIGPATKSADFSILGAEGKYAAAELDAEGRFCSTVLPGLWLEAAWLQ